MRPNLFEEQGVHCIVDGQFGSTGKGAFAAWLARQIYERGHPVDGFIYSGGPNSGHTFYHEDEKHVLKQVPTTAVALSLIEERPQTVYLSAGAIIDPEVLFLEAQRYPLLRIFVHPNAAIVTQRDKDAEHEGSIAEVAGTRSGAGSALARKITRNPDAIWASHPYQNPKNIVTLDHNLKPDKNCYFMEVSQGFSLGINSHFYPKVTSRECTVMQGLADARIPARFLAKTYMSIRTYPIRVGNVDGYSSGDWYQDQQEITWDDLGVEAEKTTVTQRIRRVATFSDIQFEDAMRANDPDWLFLNFINYLGADARYEFITGIHEKIKRYSKPIGIVIGQGPTTDDIRII